MPDPNIANLGAILRARRREKHLSLRDLADQTGVSLNTLSRVERGHVPDLKNFQLILDWLGIPAERCSWSHRADLDTRGDRAAPRADQRLSHDAATKIAEMVEEMYHKLVGEQPTLSLSSSVGQDVHTRCECAAGRHTQRHGVEPPCVASTE